MAIRVKRPLLCVFDLDGTLVDSLRDIAEAFNECLDLLGLNPRPVADYRYMVGEGVPKLCQRALGRSHPHLVKRLIEIARPRYRIASLVHTKPYPGIPPLVDDLSRRSIQLAVLSNKPHDMTARIVRAFWPNNTFGVVQGYVREERRKPSPTHLHEICETLSVAPADAWMIGDTPTDVLTAHHAGCSSIGVTWGFRRREDLEQASATRIIDQPSELLELIESSG